MDIKALYEQITALAQLIESREDFFYHTKTEYYIFTDTFTKARIQWKNYHSNPSIEYIEIRPM